jgi:hypothetical protein
MIWILLMLNSSINHHRQIKQRQGIEQDEQPIGPYRGVQGEEEKEGHDATAKALEQKQEDVPSQT